MGRLAALLAAAALGAVAGCGAGKHSATQPTTPDPCADFTVPKGAIGACDVDTLGTGPETRTAEVPRAALQVMSDWLAAVNRRDFERTCELSVVESQQTCRSLLRAAFRGYRGAVVPTPGDGRPTNAVVPFGLREGPDGLMTRGVEQHGKRLLVHFEVQLIR